MTATVPRMVESVVSARPAMMRAPTIEIAEIALVSDIRGVWSSGETRLMTSSPTKVASRKTYKEERRSGAWVMVLSLRNSSGSRGGGKTQGLAHPGLNHVAALGHQDLADDFVLGVEDQLALLHDEFEEVQQVP